MIEYTQRPVTPVKSKSPSNQNRQTATEVRHTVISFSMPRSRHSPPPSYVPVPSGSGRGFGDISAPHIRSPAVSPRERTSHSTFQRPLCQIKPSCKLHVIFAYLHLTINQRYGPYGSWKIIRKTATLFEEFHCNAQDYSSYTMLSRKMYRITSGLGTTSTPKLVKCNLFAGLETVLQ